MLEAIGANFLQESIAQWSCIFCVELECVGLTELVVTIFFAEIQLFHCEIIFDLKCF